MYCTFGLGVYSIIINHIEYSVLDMVEKWFVLISLYYSWRTSSISAIDIGSHDGFFPFKEEDAYYPNWLHMGNQSGRKETGNSSEEDAEDFQPVEDFSPLELAQHMQRKERPVPLR